MDTTLLNKIRELFSSETTGHDFYHLQRVAHNANLIAKEEGGNCEKIQLLAFLHEVGDYKLEQDKNQEDLIQKLLKNLYSNSFITQLLNDLSQISYRGGFGPKAQSLEVKIVQDADRLDALGAIGIARCFAYGGKKRRPIYDPEIPIKTFETEEEYKNHPSPSLNHFYEKLLKLKDLMNTATGRQMAEERHKFMELFLENFHREWTKQEK